MAKVKVFKYADSDADTNADTDTNLVSIERSCHKEYTCEIWKPYHLPIKSYEQG